MLETTMPTSGMGSARPILGVAAMRRKLHSTAMQAILSSVRASAGGAIEVRRYVALRSPLLVNNLYMQPLMLDRRLVRRVLARAGVPTPPAVYLDRSAGDSARQIGNSGNTLEVFSPAQALMRSIEKPFVEKPVDPDDHNVYIYYKDGGVRKLFRKVKNESSRYDATATQVRQDGDYIYERFYEPQGRSDVKVYAVGKSYFHAEARKAPHVDGIVERDHRGRERRAAVTLSPSEFHICSRVVNAFDQFILGFDLLRAPDRHRFVIDVNGWSLVKNCQEYARRCGQMLVEHVKLRLHERRSLRIRALHLARAHSTRGIRHSALVAAVPQTDADQFDNRDIPTSPTCVA